MAILACLILIVQGKKLNKKNSLTKKSKKLKSDAHNNDIPGRNAIIPTRKVSMQDRLSKSVAKVSSSLDQSKSFTKSTSNFFKRTFKLYSSSNFEKLILKMTTPDSYRILDEDMSSFLATVDSFKKSKNYSSKNNPFRVTLRKLWTKILEQNKNTTFKALYILHSLLRETDIENSLIFHSLLRKMVNIFNYSLNIVY